MGQLFAAPGAGSSSYPRKLTQRPEVAAILAPPAQATPPPSGPTIGPNPPSLTFTGVQGGATPLPQTLSITNTGGGTLSWSVTDNAPWLSLSPGSGTTTTENDAITVTVNTAGLTANAYTATITITASGATNSPRTVPVTLTLASPPGPPSSGTATLTWNSNAEPDLAGYRIYVGLASGTYGLPINVGNVTTYQVTNLALGQTYFFTLTAVDTSNNESGFSNEVSRSIF
ncbi:MAG: BACON domain-containing protein [Nitrospiraceae bacterium]